MDRAGDGSIDLMLFEHRPDRVAEGFRAGISSFVVDCENQGKKTRQVGFDTEINHDAPDDLRGVKSQPGATAVCRIDRFGSGTSRQVDLAIHHGADLLLLPMVTGCDEVERFLRQVDGRCRAGILVETEAACSIASRLARFPLDAVYVGLNDLMIGRGGRNLFEPILDGTLDALREAFPNVPFGFGGCTAIDRGTPIPCRMLLQEMARLRCAFTFLRRSFKRDVARGEITAAVSRIHGTWRALLHRSPSDVRADHEALRACISALGGG